jgi:hypothetical protein
MTYRRMDWTGDHCVKWHKAVPQRQKSHFLLLSKVGEDKTKQKAKNMILKRLMGWGWEGWRKSEVKKEQ